MSKLKKIILEEIENHINEVGEASAKSFPFEYYRVNPPNSTYDESRYEFTTDKGTEYEVSILNRNNNGVISFAADDDDDLQLTNRNEVYSVMTTIVNIIKDFDEKIGKPEGVDKLTFFPVDKDEESNKPLTADGNSRSKLYAAYVNKHIGNKFNVRSEGNGQKITLERK